MAAIFAELSFHFHLLSVRTFHSPVGGAGFAAASKLATWVGKRGGEK